MRTVEVGGSSDLDKGRISVGGGAIPTVHLDQDFSVRVRECIYHFIVERRYLAHLLHGQKLVNKEHLSCPGRRP